MNARTKISRRGDVAIPRNVLERLKWEPGTPLEIVETGDGLKLSAASAAAFPRKTLADLRALPKARGPVQPAPAISRLSDDDIRRLTEYFRRL